MSAKSVKIAGNFSNWESKPLKKNKNGIWYEIIPVGTEFQKDRLHFEYKFNIDGLWDGTQWLLTQSSIGSSDVALIIDSSGQMRYDSPNYAGFIDGRISFKYTIMEKGI